MRNWMYRIFYSIILLLAATPTLLFADGVPAELDGLAKDVRQAVVVEGSESGGVQARVSAWERDNGGWTLVLGPAAAVIGRNGLAPAGQKREGDGRTPSGVFALRRAFGYAPDVSTGLSYRPVTFKDFWIDDPASPQYNQWVSGDVPAASHEVLRRSDGLYKYAVVIEYNTDPVTPGWGSAIFLHVWRGADEPTTGCVAMAQTDVRGLLHWLEARHNPVILLGAGGSRITADKDDDELYSPLRIEIKMKKDTFRVREPVQGTVIVENKYPAALPAVFKIRLFHEGKQVDERITSVKRLPPWKTRFSFKNFGIPQFNNGPGTQGLWRITIVQQSRDERYPAQAIIRIVAPATAP